MKRGEVYKHQFGKLRSNEDGGPFSSLSFTGNARALALNKLRVRFFGRKESM